MRERWAVRLYRWVLRLLPRGFRKAYGDDAVRDFAAAVEEARRTRGRRGATAVTARAVGDVVRRAPGERWRERQWGRASEEGWTMMWMRELRSAAKGLARRPGFSFVVVLTLALGIGATVAIFTVVDSVLLRPLAYPDADRIVTLEQHAPGLDLQNLGSSEGMANFYRQNARSLESFALFDSGSRNLTGTGPAARIQVAEVTPSFFDVLGVSPGLGRAFTVEDAGPGAPLVTVLLHDTWVSRFGSDPGILGRTITLDGAAVEVLGVMPAGFEAPDPDAEVLLPSYVPPDAEFGSFGSLGIGRLAPDVSLEDARREMEALQPRVAGFFPDLTPDFLEQAGWSVSVETLQDRIVRDVRSALWVVMATVGFVLLIACANVANLCLVRAEERQREVAIRAAMGAGRGRLAATFLAESLVLGGVAGVVGVLVAAWGVRVLTSWGPMQLPRLQEIHMDGTILLFAATVTILASLAFGSLPVLRYLGRSFARVLREGGRGATDGRARQRTRNLLVAGQLALALVLLVASGLMLRTFQELRSMDPGFDPENVLAVGLSVGDEPGQSEAAARYQAILDRLAALPGVAVAGATNSLPLDPTGVSGGSFAIRSRPRQEGDLPPVTVRAAVSEGFFRAMGIPVLRGRDVERADHEDPRPVAWVSDSFARAYFDGHALGEQIYVGEYDPDETDADVLPWMTIVGVVGDVHQFRLQEDVRPLAYFPMHGPADARIHLASMTFVLRTEGDPTALIPGVRAAVREVDPEIPLTRVRTMQAVLSDSLASTSFTMVLLAIAAGVAILLGAVGIYGVIAWLVSRRTREIGVRMALGAGGRDVRRMVLGQGMAVAVLGIVAGLAAAFGLTRLMESLLFGVSTSDPATFTAVTVTVATVAAVATWLPAQRATRVDPAESLRGD